MTEVPERQLYINGRWQKPRSRNRRLDIVNPSTGSTIGSIPSADTADVDLAVEAAASALAAWSGTAASKRAELLRKMAGLIKDRKTELARLETMDNGKPIAEAEADMDDVVACFEFYAGLGEQLDSSREKDVDVGDSSFSTGSTIGSIPSADTADVDLAVEAAASALAAWSGTAASKRAELLRKMAGLIKDRKTELARLETMDNGKPIAEAEADMDDVVACFEFYAGLGEQLDSSREKDVDVGDSSFRSRVRKEPLGVVAAISAWNYPLLIAAWKVAPALAAGNTVVLKPSEAASITCLELGDVAHRAGLPPGVLNIISGLGTSAGAPLSSHPGVAKVAFTGSVATGRAVNLAAAKNLRPATMELGGKGPIIVFSDVDVDKAVEWVAMGIFFNAGQVCSATSRLIVHKDIEKQLLAKLKIRAESIRIADPLDAATRMGPIISEQQYNKVLQYIEGAKKEGAKVLTGGKRPPALPQGFFVEPTIFTDVLHDMTVWREEVFGPVLAVASFSSEEEAVCIANASEYGLGAAVISDDKERCQRVANALQVGIVWINCSQPTFVQAPWGGVKNSGFGRELGEWGMDTFMSVKQVTEYTSNERMDWYPEMPSKL